MRWLRENWLDFLIFVLIAVVAVGVVLYLVGLNPFAGAPGPAPGPAGACGYGAWPRWRGPRGGARGHRPAPPRGAACSLPGGGLGAHARFGTFAFGTHTA